MEEEATIVFSFQPLNPCSMCSTEKCMEEKAATVFHFQQFNPHTNIVNLYGSCAGVGGSRTLIGLTGIK